MPSSVFNRPPRAPLMLVAALLVPALAVAGLNPAAAQGGGERPPPPVTLVTATKQSVEVTKEYSGRARASRQVEVRARVEGILEERLYVEGQFVEQDAPLFRIDPTSYEIALQRAQAERAEAEARLNQAENNFQRYDRLYERNATSESERDRTYFERELAAAQVALADAAVAEARRNLGYTTVEAPVAGLTDLKTLSEGNLIDRGTLLTSIMQPDPIHVRFSFPEDDAAAQWAARRTGADGEESRRKATLLGPLGEDYEHGGTVDFTDASVDPRTGTVSARAVFPNPDMDVVPGQFVRIALVADRLTDVVVIPEVAVGEGRGGPQVFVVDAEDVAHVRRVRLGPVVEAGHVILDGLNEGDRVVVRGQVALADGMTVAPEKAGEGDT